MSHGGTAVFSLAKLVLLLLLLSCRGLLLLPSFFVYALSDKDSSTVAVYSCASSSGEDANAVCVLLLSVLRSVGPLAPPSPPPTHLLRTHIDNCGLDDEVEVVSAAAAASVLRPRGLAAEEPRAEEGELARRRRRRHRTHTEQRKKRTELTHIQYTHTVCVRVCV